MNQNFEPYKSMAPGKKVVELRKLANGFGKQPSDVDTFLAGLVDSCDCQSGFADAVLKIFEKAWKKADLKGIEMYMNLFRAFTGIEFSDFLNSAYIMATIRAQERAAEDPKEWARIGKSREEDVTDARIVSRWKPDIVVVTPCRVDLRTRKVVELCPVRCVNGDDPLKEETVQLQDVETPVWDIDMYARYDNPADVYKELLRIQREGDYWYSSSGLDLYEELVKAHESMQVVPESEEPDETPAGMTTWHVPATWSMSGYVQVQAESAEKAVRTAQERVDEFNLPKDAQYIEDSFDIDLVARPIPEIVLKDTEGNSRPVPPRNSSDIATGLFVSHWNSGTQVVAPCDVNLKSREVNNICAWFGPAEDDGDQFIRETVTVNGQEYPVQNIDDIVTGLEPTEAHERLVRIKENPSPEFWYSLNDRTLEEEIAKAKIASVSKPEDNSDAEIVEAQFVSYWEDGEAITTHCKANLETREIIEIETSDGGVDHGFCVDENVIIEDEEFAVRNLDSVVETENSGELYQLLLNMKKCSMLWYSRSGLNFYAELVKAHIAAYPLRLCDGYCDEVTISIKESDSQFFEYRTDEDEVYSLHRPDDDCGERVSGVLADAVRLFAKEQMQLNPGRWLTPENCWQAPADFKN